MLANFERKALYGAAHTSVHKYRGLKNLPHWHMEHELVFAAEGTAEVMTGSNLFTLDTGMCVFIRGEEVHYISSPPESEIWIMKIEPSFCKAISRKRLKNPLSERDYDLRSRLDRIQHELCGMEYGELIADSIMTQIIAEIFRTEETETVTDDASDEKYKALIREISRRYADITFDDAAEFMCLSRPYFSKYFHRLSGMTFTEYLNIVRVSEAAKMISEGGLSMTGIAGKCGFGTIRSFNRVFRQLTGCSPRELPKDYAFIRSDEADSGFDPTLSCTVVIPME